MLITQNYSNLLSNYYLPFKSIKRISYKSHQHGQQEFVTKPFKSRTKLDSMILEGENKVGLRHFPAAVKEWKNSSYTFNKKSLRLVANKDNMTTILIQSYFHFSNNKALARSKRMRDLRRKLTTKRLFVSKPDIKQTNDKVVVTVFTFNREKQFLLRKLFFFNRRVSFLEMWRRNYSLDPKTNSMLDSLLDSTKEKYLDTNIDKNEEIHNIIKNLVKFDKLLAIKFISGLVTIKKNKLKLYCKLFAEMHSYVSNMHDIDNPKLKDVKFYKTKIKEIFFIANKKNINNYSKKYQKMFKKKVKQEKPWYVRKKMKRYVPDPPKLTRRERSKIAKRVFPYAGIKLKNEMNFLSYKLLLKNKRFVYARKLFYYYFLKYVLSMFNIKVYAFKDSNEPNYDTMKKILLTDELLNIEKQIKKKRKGKRNKKSKFVYDVDKKALRFFKSPSSLTPQGNKVKICFYSVKRNRELKKKIKRQKTNKCLPNLLGETRPIVVNIEVLKTKNKLNNLDYVLSNVNFVISQFLGKMLTKSLVREKERKLYVIFKRYCKRNYLNFLSKFWKQEALLSNNYTRFMINRFKFSKFLPNLKILISKIYNKKTELNIVNLKYSHLNTDIYTDTIALKLRKKLNLLKVIRKAIKLAKKPLGYLDRTKLNIDYDISKIHNLNKYRSLKLKNLNKGNIINTVSFQAILKKIYPRSLANNTSYISKKNSLDGVRVITSKVKNILNIIKYKTLAGVRIEGAGRITRRYTASRAVFKFKYKGSLRNIDYSRKLEFMKTSMPTVMLRNQVKANSQYSINSKKRRIGAFGIKGWISGY